MKLFEPIVINGVTIPNRVVKSAMAENLCDARGRPLPGLVSLYENWSRGGVGLSITGIAHVREGCGFLDGDIGIYSDDLIAPLQEVTGAVHRHPGKVFLQLCHAFPQVSRRKARRLGCVAPSAGFNRANLLFNREMTDADIRRLIGEFGAGARRAREAGFDGVQLHAAHGWLLSRFISPRHNRRRDRWGGSFDNRVALLEEILGAIRAEVGGDYPVTIKLNAHDGEPRGLTVDEAVRIAGRLEERGIDAVEVSAGTADVAFGFYPNRGALPADLALRFIALDAPFARPILPLLRPVLRAAARKARFPGEAYFYPEARRFAEALSIPVMSVGGIRFPETAERILTESRVAMVSMARPFVRQPNLVEKWRAGTGARATCVSCNRCFMQIGLGEPLRCWARREAAAVTG
jgi:2,4-dienoyl-CoA reductase-like NADH-dependent reductase (Old Yellow Enzyme family)